MTSTSEKNDTKLISKRVQTELKLIPNEIGFNFFYNVLLLCSEITVSNKTEKNGKISYFAEKKSYQKSIQM